MGVRGPEIGMVAAAILLPVVGLAILIATAVWVYKDATSRGIKEAAIWTVGSLIAWPIVFIVYLIVRPGKSSNPA